MRKLQQQLLVDPSMTTPAYSYRLLAVVHLDNLAKFIVQSFLT